MRCRPARCSCRITWARTRRPLPTRGGSAGRGDRRWMIGLRGAFGGVAAAGIVARSEGGPRADGAGGAAGEAAVAAVAVRGESLTSERAWSRPASTGAASAGRVGGSVGAAASAVAGASVAGAAAASVAGARVQPRGPGGGMPPSGMRRERRASQVWMHRSRPGEPAGQLSGPARSDQVSTRVEGRAAVAGAGERDALGVLGGGAHVEDAVVVAQAEHDVPAAHGLPGGALVGRLVDAVVGEVARAAHPQRPCRRRRWRSRSSGCALRLSSRKVAPPSSLR